MNIYVKLAIVLAIEFVFGQLTRRLKLPSVSCYLIAALLLGLSLFGLIGEVETNTLSWISEISLSFIAFGIGGELLVI